LTLVLVAAASGCAADAYYERGQAWETRDPSAAAEYYRLCLAEDPQHPGARDRVNGFDFYGPLVALARGSEERGEWGVALKSYDRLVELAGVLKAIGGATPPFDLAPKREEAARRAAAARFDDGRRAQAQGDDAAATRAFRECMALDPAHAEAGAAYREAHAKALRRVAILPVEAAGAADLTVARELADAVVAKITQRKPELIELVTRTHLDQVLDEHDLNATMLVDPSTAAASGKLLGLHLIVVGRLSAIERSDSGWVEETQEQTVERERDGQKVKLTASWTVRTRTTRAAMTLTVQAIDVETGAVRLAEQVARDRTSTSRHARKVSGDDEALPAEVARLCREAETAPTSPDDLALSLVPTISDAAAAALVGRLQ
jgi:tetratricopeptide (TPR) repeat protein